MSRDKTDAILKVVVKHFFIEKEVTSTLVMDSLYSGLKSLEYQSKNMKGTAKLGESEELPVPMVHIDQDFFVLADDIIILIERVVSDSLSHQPSPSKDDKYSQNRTKVGKSRSLKSFIYAVLGGFFFLLDLCILLELLNHFFYEITDI